MNDYGMNFSNAIITAEGNLRETFDNPDFILESDSAVALSILECIIDNDILSTQKDGFEMTAEEFNGLQGVVDDIMNSGINGECSIKLGMSEYKQTFNTITDALREELQTVRNIPTLTDIVEPS